MGGCLKSLDVENKEEKPALIIELTKALLGTICRMQFHKI